MKKAAKFVLIGLATVAIGTGVSSAFAGSPGCRNMEGGMMSHSDKGKFAKFIEKRQAELHKKLNLTAEQEPAWNTFAEKMKATMPQGRPDKEEMRKLSTPERLDKMLARMKEGEKQMETRAATIKEFYAALTPEQRKVFDEQSHSHGRHFR
jgi:Spy/CpxP family protein refolding chaperone